MEKTVRKVAFVNGPTEGYRVSRNSRWPERTKSGTLYYPIWLAYATANTKKAGFEVLLIDAEARGLEVEAVAEKLKDFGPDLIVVDVTTPTFENDMKNVEVFGKIGAKIVLVGTHVSALPETAFQSSKNVDFVVRGEYDSIIVNLAKNIRRPSVVKGVSYKRGKRIIHNKPADLVEELDRFPWVSPVYKEFLRMNDYSYSLAQKPMIQIFTSRGCPNMCSFCQYPQVFSGRKFRVRSIKDVVSEIEWINKNLPEVKEIFIEDDTFTIDRERVREFCQSVMDKKMKITWSVNARANLDYETMVLMKKAGCRLLVVGYESGSDKILKGVRKGITVEMSRRFAKASRKAGLKVFGCFMLGLPGETRETMEQTFRLAKELEPDMVFFQQAVPFPGTEMHQWADAGGYLKVGGFSEWHNQDGYLEFLLSYPGLDKEEIRRTRGEFMKRYYFRPGFIVKTLFRNLGSFDEFKRIVRAGWSYVTFLIKEGG